MNTALAEWSAEARLASQVWFGMNAATRWLVMREYGQKVALDLEDEFMRVHQRHHFLDGPRRIGLLDEPHPILCAR